MCVSPSPIRPCGDFVAIDEQKPLVNLPRDPHARAHVEIGTSYGSHPHLLQREEEAEQT